MLKTKTNAQKQKEYKECLRAKENSDYVIKKDKEGKEAKRDMLENSPAQYNEYKKKTEKGKLQRKC